MSIAVYPLKKEKLNEIIHAEDFVLIDFFASWCGPCKMFSPIIDEISKLYEGKVNILKVDIDESEEIASQYSIQSVPTLILFKKGEIVFRNSGVMSLEECQKILNENIK